MAELGLPARLRPFSQTTTKFARLVWLAILLFAIAADLAALVYVSRDYAHVRPAMARIGLTYEVDYYEGVTVEQLPPGEIRFDGPVLSRIERIEGNPIPHDATIGQLRTALEGVDKPNIRIELRGSDGTLKPVLLERRNVPADRSPWFADNSYMATRMALALLACVVLLSCSTLLALRRPSDPVAMILAIAFAGMAATIDPPLPMWMGLGLSWIDDAVAACWFYLLMIGLATFPNGVFVPRPFRWLVPLGIPITIFLSLPNVDGTLQGLTGAFVLLLIVGSQISRYRRLPTGVERQQIKWAAFGFGVGVILLACAFVAAAALADVHGNIDQLGSLIVLSFFSVGMLVIPLGLLIALTRFRLWEADTVITRSAAYAVVTMLVGIVWAASADLAKLIISSIMGQQHEAGATAIGAIVAVGVFGPTQHAVLGWTRQRFASPADRLGELPNRLKEWSVTEAPDELGDRILTAIEDALHPTSALLYADADGTAEELARMSTEPNADRGPHQTLQLSDEIGSVGRLVLGPRTDGNRYSHKELEALQDIARSIASALRTSRTRHGKELRMEQMIDQMQERLSQLEGGPKPSPA